MWHSSLTKENSSDLDRVQKAAIRTIMGPDQSDYKTSLKELHMEELSKRKNSICLNFVKKNNKEPQIETYVSS